ncbi:hypothetical protein EV702DRAFT_1202275 [Suillus placidus]|uniref:Uncharacterized protein n=1 Tax=Suillus placidus TaxID=48579 RepID=A0A9P6ZMY3_9AGAM|nr:hypothetical protein EV702DRAFT_1202275 [Suillus placidus]
MPFLHQAACAGHEGRFHRHVSTYVYFRTTVQHSEPILSVYYLRRIDNLTICFVLPCDLRSAISQLRSRASSLSCLPRWQDEFRARPVILLCVLPLPDCGHLEHSSVAGCVEENWSNLSLEEMSALSLPLDKDVSDAVLVGLEFDLTSTELFHHTSASMEGVHSPPSSIMHAYASDGTIKQTPHRGMVTHFSGAMMESAQTLIAMPTVMMRESSNDTHASCIELTPSASASTFVQTTPDFDQLSALGKLPSFGRSSFGQQLESPFGQTTTANAFQHLLTRFRSVIIWRIIIRTTRAYIWVYHSISLAVRSSWEV